jgi:hypothetical protein
MRAVLRWAAIGAGLVLVAATAFGWAAYRKFSGNIRTDRASVRLLDQDARERPRALVPGARNILVIGGGEGRGLGAALLLHLSPDRRRATAVAVPRDLVVRVPDCPRPGGGAGPAAYEDFSAAYRAGGAACSILAFERLSGIRVDHHLVVDRRGRGHGGGLLRALAHGARGGLAHPVRLYGMLDSATSSLTADPGLSSLPALYELAGALRALPPGALVFRRVPTARDFAGREVPREPEAGRLFAAVRADRRPAVAS